MSDESELRLTPEDPISKEVLAHLELIYEKRAGLAERVMDLEMQRVRLVALASGLDEERARIFQRELTLRGLPPSTKISVDPVTGKIDILDLPKAPKTQL